MNYKGVDIYSCKFFTIDQANGKLKFSSGINRGKTSDDFKTIQEIKKIIAYCFWLITDEKYRFPIVTKYTASAFLKEMMSKLSEIEEAIRGIATEEQERLQQKTEELTKTTGTKYI